MSFRFDDYVDLDKLGMGLSFFCALHCLLMPVMMLSLPIMARYYLGNPWFHFVMAILILPVGIFAFVKGYKHHRNKKVFYFGLPGLMLISFSPLLVHVFALALPEYPLMIFGSSMLIYGHWLNRQSCSCNAHSH